MREYAQDKGNSLPVIDKERVELITSAAPFRASTRRSLPVGRKVEFRHRTISSCKHCLALVTQRPPRRAAVLNNTRKTFPHSEECEFCTFERIDRIADCPGNIIDADVYIWSQFEGEGQAQSLKRFIVCLWRMVLSKQC